MQVEVDEADAASATLLEPGERAELDRAVPAQHEGQGAVGRGDPLGRLDRHVTHRLDVLGERMLPVGEPSADLAVASISHVGSCRREPVDQPRPAECGGRPLLPGRERPHAARHADHVDRPHRSLPLRWGRLPVKK